MNNDENPFSITKASRLSAESVLSSWVDGHQTKHLSLLKSSIPVFVLGGKGCGKTHLMRYYSFDIQSLRKNATPMEAVKENGFVGIYVSSEKLRVNRFSEKKQSEQTWRSVFEYYLELSLCLSLLKVIHSLSEELAIDEIESSLITEINNLFESSGDKDLEKISELITYIEDLIYEVDYAVSNCGITGQLSLKAKVSMGKLIFGVPKIILSHVSQFKGIGFYYFLDELELLNVTQQKHLNTLIRECDDTTSFKIGSRLYGLKTYETNYDGEENKQGSEFDKISLDQLGLNHKDYTNFCVKLINSRLESAGFYSVKNSGLDIKTFFDTRPRGEYSSKITSFILNKDEKQRRYFNRLEKNLHDKGYSSEAIQKVIEALSCPKYPLLEKVGILRLYKNKSAITNDVALVNISHLIMQERESMISGQKGTRFEQSLGHFQHDLIAQLHKEYNVRISYCGLDELIWISSGLVRNLLIILQKIYDISNFKEEYPLTLKARNNPNKISIESQTSGILEASNWFFKDARIKGERGVLSQRVMRNLCELFKSIRFSDKIVDSSLSTFAVKESALSTSAGKIIDDCSNYSMLIQKRSEHIDRNSHTRNKKYQIIPMIAPLWDLPFTTRGVIELSPEECDVLFSASSEDKAIQKVIKNRVTRMTANKFIKKSTDQEWFL